MVLPAKVFWSTMLGIFISLLLSSAWEESYPLLDIIIKFIGGLCVLATFGSAIWWIWA
jgi:hypothetical protein